MENFLYKDLDHAERMKLLVSSCISRETMTFQRSLSENELDEKKDFYTREQMRLATMEESLKEYKARKAADIKALKKDNEDLLGVIANQAIEVFDQVFLVPDHANSIVLFVDKFGEIVHRREMKPEERQGRLLLDESYISDEYKPDEKTENENTAIEQIDFEEVKEPSGNEVEAMEPEKKKRKKSTKKTNNEQ